MRMSGSSDAATTELDSLSPTDVARLVDEATRGRLRSAKALRDALQLPVSVQRVQQLLASEYFQSRVRQRARHNDVEPEAAQDDGSDDDDDGDDDEEEEEEEEENDDDDDDDVTIDAHPLTTDNTVRQQDASARASKRHSALPLGANTNASVSKPDGTRLTLQVHQTFADRARLRYAVREFVAAQSKSVKIHKPTNGGSSFTYVCKSPSACTFFVKVRRVNRRQSSVHTIVALCGEHGDACTGKPLKARYALGARQQRIAESAPASVTLRDGSTLTLHAQQEFRCRSDLKDFIHDFALAQGKRARVDRTASGGNNTTFICTSATPCAFTVRSLRSKPSGVHVVRSFDVTHSATCTGKPSVTKRQVLQQLTRMQAAPTLALSGADVQAFVKSLEGVDVTSRVASDARCELVGRALRDATAGIQHLESLLAHFESLNPTARTLVAFDARARTLTRAFVQLPFAVQMQRHSARVLGLVAVDMLPASNVRGTLFELVTRDGNNEPCTLAVGLSTAATTESYVWFLDCCRTGGLALDAPMLCDRNSALLSAAESLAVPFTLIQCTQSLIAGIEERLQCTVTPDARDLIVRAQDADSAVAYSRVLAALRASHADVATQLLALDANTWAKHCYVGRCALYGCASASLATSSCATELPAHVLAARALGPFELFQGYMERCMKAWYDGKRNAKNWASAGRKLTAYGENALKALERDARACRVVPSDDEQGIAYVSSAPPPSINSNNNNAAVLLQLPPTKCRVNLRANTCSCPAVEQLALPCKHLVAAASFFNADSGASWDASLLAHTLYSAKRYFDVYAHVRPIEMPVEDELVRNPQVRVAPAATTNRCSLCHDIGHNKRRCPLNRPEAIAPTDSNGAPPPAALPDTEMAVMF